MAIGPVEILRRDLESCVLAGGRPIIWGPAGVGKSALIENLAHRMGHRLTTIIGSMADPTDVNGFPVVNRDKRVTDAQGREHPVVELAPPRVFTDLNEGPKWGLFLDEFTSVPGSVSASWLRLVHGGIAGQYPLDMSRGFIICAANPPDEAVNGQELAGPMVNRLAHFQFPVSEASAIEWATNFPSYWDDPDQGWAPKYRPAGLTVESLVKARSMVAEFVRRVPSVWHPAIQGSKFAITDTTCGWPSPRSLDRASRHLALALSRSLPPVSCLNLVAAEIGGPAATEFQTYVNTADIPDPEAVLADPEGWTFSGRVDLDFTVMLAVSAAVTANLTADRLFAAFKVCERSVTDRNGAPAKEAAYASMVKLSRLATDTTSTYKQLTKGNSEQDNLKFGTRLQKAMLWFHKVVDTAKGK